MNPSSIVNESAVASELHAIQLEVARRADELARRLGPGRAADRRAWLRAEQEIFERWESQQSGRILSLVTAE